MLFEMRTKGIKVAGSFGHLRGPVDNRAGLSLHDGKDPFALVEKGSVQKKMSMSRQFDFVNGRMFKPMLDDASNGAHAVTALSCELSHGVALNNPPLEPNPLPEMFVGGVFPTKRVSALATKPTLFSLPTFTIALDAN